jgi:6,7-dimethyl-8-ribityllumazine synthase
MKEASQIVGTDGSRFRVGIVCSRFNRSIVDGLLAGARRGLTSCGVADDRIEVVFVPGAFEIPVAARAMADTGRFDALLTLGAVIRGETAHFDYVAGPCADGVARVQLDTGIPIGFGVLTTNTLEQAVARSSGDDNKGEEAALVAIEMANLVRLIRGA